MKIIKHSIPRPFTVVANMLSREPDRHSSVRAIRATSRTNQFGFCLTRDHQAIAAAILLIAVLGATSPGHVAAQGANWLSSGYDLENTRFNAIESGITPENVG